MTNKKAEYRKDVAFINRQKELAFLEEYISDRPESILFLHGPKSSGKTTLLYKFLEQVGKKQDLNVKFLNLRETFTNVYEDFLKTFFEVQKEGEKKENLETNINVGFFKINSTVEKKILEKRADPFKVMKAEFLKLNKKGVKPILVIDELQALDKVYIDNDKERLLIIALFNFFVAMTKESHLAHIIISSSDGYFINQVFTDSRLKKTAIFYKIDYLRKEDVTEWLLNLEKYSKIKAYKLSTNDVEKIWDTVGGSMWEIQDILSGLFNKALDQVTSLYIKKIRNMIVDYVVKPGKMEIEKLLRHFIDHDELSKAQIDPEEEKLLRDMVRQNILYYDPTEAKYYPQGRSFHNGIRVYFSPES
ncbi:MAG: ATP-binding protein [Candidatus Aminicenantes bacterium]|nr:ATP-binding protein [Candidatus Aminicenantes bacterium]